MCLSLLYTFMRKILKIVSNRLLKKVMFLFLLLKTVRANSFHNYYSVALLCSIIICVGCTSKQDIKPKIPSNVVFTVDSTLISMRMQALDSGITYCAPKTWKPLDAALQAQIQQKMEEQNSSEIRINTSLVYRKENGMSALAVSELQFPSQSALSGAENINTFVRRITSSLDSTTVQVARFKKGEIPLTQIVIRTPESVNFKVLLSTKNRILLFDYILAMPEFTTEIRAVESSIGSILISQLP